MGFRPFVYTLAVRHQLTGFVLNSPRGVFIEVEGAAAAIEAFVADLPAHAPPLVRIAEIRRSTVPVQGDAGFAIRASEGDSSAFALVPPDFSVCAPCLSETRDPHNRRFEYPFTNCTNCGPRYSIILDIPYDRPLTTMAEFAMCPACQREYEDPENRRFHAQPNACAACGPQLTLSIPSQCEPMPRGTRPILERVADLLHDGRIVAWKGLGGYQLACDARQPHAVENLRRRKHRSEKPFAIMVANVDVACSLCFVSPGERELLLSSERPIVLLQRRGATNLAPGVSPGNPAIGVMLPCTPMHDLLFRILQERWGFAAALIMTSGNISEEPIVVDHAAAEEHLAGVADAFVHHNRRIHTRLDDSVVRLVAGDPILLRRARGYAPRPLWLGRGDVEVLACGAQQKSTLCLTRAGFALPSQHLGDLENIETFEFFRQTLERMQRLFHVTPTVIAHDLHPEYLSTRFALSLPGVRPIAVQHHHAHIASCMAEHQLEGPVIGVAWDGTGLGTDGTIWGGEFLIASYTHFERWARLRPILLAGGDAAIREPWRIARSSLFDAFDGVIPDPAADHLPAPSSRIRIIDAMLRRHVNTIPTSSAGRLFDAVASLAGLCHTVSFEGQAAIMLEAAADAWTGPTDPPYSFALSGSAPVNVDLRPMIREIMTDREHARPPHRIAARLHVTLVAIVATIAEHMRAACQLNRVCLSGGCFQNARLLQGCVASLRDHGFEVFVQRQVPANDGGISLGQAAIACETVRQKSGSQSRPL